MRSRQLRRGFTLIEMLVVIAIIGILTAIAIPTISSVKTRSQVKALEANFQRMRLAIENYSNDFGDYPPSRFKKLGLRRSNGMNDGIECLVRCLTTGTKSGPYMTFKDEELGNLDNDKLSNNKNPTESILNTKDLFEVVDPWGNPIVYLHNMDYDRGGTMSLKMGGSAAVTAAKSAKTGQFSGHNTFQLFSAGPDGLVGTEDDVRAWGE